MVGRFLLSVLRADGCAVIALSRQVRGGDDGDDGVAWVQGTLPDGVPSLPAAEAIVSLGPLDHFASWLERVELHGQPRIVALSSMSAESKRAAPLAAERELAARLRAAEAKLAARCAQRGLAWTVLRATLIYDGSGEHGLATLARRAQRWRVFPLPAGRGLRQPVHARDLAAAVQAALDGGADGCVLAAGGGERITVRRMFARLDTDLVADNREMEARLGVRPGPFRP
jgi:nucleoside-diphosphate-sugar epimerase